MKRFVEILILAVLFICTLVSCSPKGETELTAPIDAAEYNGHYYKYFGLKINWHQAKKICEEMGGHLVTISNADENSFAASLVESEYGAFIGANDEADEGNYTWVTGEELVYTNWFEGEPNDYHNQDMALIHKNGGWDDFYNNHLLGFICEWDDFSAPSVPDDAVAFADTHYKVFEIPLDWDFADYYCKMLGGHLVTVTGDDENEFVHALVDQREIWIGGICDSRNKRYIWTTDERFSYAAWAKKYPTEFFDSRYRTRMNENGEWKFDYNFEKKIFVCEWGISEVNQLNKGWITFFWVCGIVAALVVGFIAFCNILAKKAPPPPPPRPTYSGGSNEPSYSSKYIEESEYYKAKKEEYYNMYMGITPQKKDANKQWLDDFEESWMSDHYNDTTGH